MSPLDRVSPLLENLFFPPNPNLTSFLCRLLDAVLLLPADPHGFFLVLDLPASSSATSKGSFSSVFAIGPLPSRRSSGRPLLDLWNFLIDRMQNGEKSRRSYESSG